MADPRRRDELATCLAQVRDRIRAACAASGRDEREVVLVVVTKFFPASDVRLLAELGVGDVGESRHQEAADKVEACHDLGLTWHFVGRLQRNKAAAVAGWAHAVHSVDREVLVPRLSRGASEAGREVAALVQVDLDPAATGPDPTGRGGASPQQVQLLAETVASAPGLALRGVMGIPVPDDDPAAAFGRLGEAARVVRRVEPAASWVSAGMSGDLEAAVAAGATHVRVGTAILGNRPRGL